MQHVLLARACLSRDMTLNSAPCVLEQIRVREMEQKQKHRKLGWLNAVQRGGGSNIRDYVIVHGKIVKDSGDTRTTDSSDKGAQSRGRDKDCLKQLTLDKLVRKSKKPHSRWATVPVTTREKSDPWKNGVPASVITKGVRKKASSHVDLGTMSHSRLAGKENVQDEDPLPNLKPEGNYSAEATPISKVCATVSPRGSNVLRSQAWQHNGARYERKLYSINSTRMDVSPNTSACPEATSASADRHACAAGDEHTHSRTDGEGQELSSDAARAPSPSSTSDTQNSFCYANTEELLAELSYCEKIKV